MKKFIFIALLAIITSVLVVQSCSSDVSSHKGTEEIFEMPEFIKNTSINGLIIPDDTKVFKVSNSKVNLVYPEGVFLVVYNSSNGEMEMQSEGSYECTCSDSGGCNVLHSNKTGFGCAHGECSGDCTGKYAGVSPTGASQLIDESIDLAFIDTNLKISSITDPTEIDKLPYVTGIVVKNPFTQKDLISYAKMIYGDVNYKSAIQHVGGKKFSDKSNFNDVVYVYMKMYGYKFIYGIRTSSLLPKLMKSNSYNFIVDDGESHACECNSGSSGCSADSSWGVDYCEGGSCTSCKMTIK